MRRSLRLPLAAGIAAGALVLTSCSGGGGDEGSGGEQVLHVGLGGETPVLIAGNDQGNLGMMLNSLVHRGLVAYDAEGELVPALAAEFEQVAPNEYRFTLQEDAKFQDGTDVTIDSVRNTFEYFADPAHGSSSAAVFASVASVEEADGEIVVTLEENNAAFLQFLADPNTPILPDRGLDPEVDNNVGAGPFQVVDKQAGVRETLEAFEDYYAADEVSLDQVDLAFYPDGAARVNALLGGDVDLIDYVPWESFEQISSTDGYTVDSQNGPGNHLQFNTEVEPWGDPQVREAVAYAINRESLVNSVFEGHGLEKYGNAVQEGSEYDVPESTELYEYDPDHARQLLAEAGYPDGFTTRLLNNSQYAFSQDTTLQLQSDLEAVGITVELDTPDWPTVMEQLGSGDYDLAVGAYYAPNSDPSHILNFVTGGSMYKSYGYENEGLNSALRGGVSAPTDEERLAEYAQAYEIMKTDVPFVLFAQRGQAFAYSDRVEGFKTLPGFQAFYSGYTIEDVEVQ